MQAYVVEALTKLGSAPLVNRGGRQVGNVAPAIPVPRVALRVHGRNGEVGRPLEHGQVLCL